MSWIIQYTQPNGRTVTRNTFANTAEELQPAVAELRRRHCYMIELIARAPGAGIPRKWLDDDIMWPRR
ncbi:MAG: hypothetical protein EBR82_00115 [Caulobacteraceae bacterium]|nr:hypothetical protein [Caulobacteraceae bacterium]